MYILQKLGKDQAFCIVLCSNNIQQITATAVLINKQIVQLIHTANVIVCYAYKTIYCYLSLVF